MERGGQCNKPVGYVRGVVASTYMSAVPGAEVKRVCASQGSLQHWGWEGLVDDS